MEMGAYMEVSADLPLAVYQKDKEKTLQVLEAIAENVATVTDFKKSKLYRHMNFSKSGAENIKWMLAKSLDKDEDLEFLKDDERFWKVQEKLGSMME